MLHGDLREVRTNWLMTLNNLKYVRKKNIINVIFSIIGLLIAFHSSLIPEGGQRITNVNAMCVKVNINMRLQNLTLG